MSARWKHGQLHEWDFRHLCKNVGLLPQVPKPSKSSKRKRKRKRKPPLDRHALTQELAKEWME